MYVDHEVRIRMVENAVMSIDKKFDKLESKIDSQFHWLLGSIFVLIICITTLFGTVALHTIKLI